jgi:nitric oxide reductase NorE protein
MVETARAKVRAKAERHLPGEEGTWIFILGDMTVFALLFGVYVDARAKDPLLFHNQQELLNQNFGAINTLLLLSSSLFVVTAIRALRSLNHRKLAPPLFAAAFVVGGCGFTLMKYIEWSQKLSHDITPGTNDFWMYYYILTGLHFFHLLLGMAVLTFLFFQSRKPSLSQRQFAFVEGGACFWHMVDLLWIVLFPLLYLVK